MGFALGPKAIGSGYRLAAYETIGSTSTEALARARAGDPGQLWVVSQAQTAGHGRRGRPWQTPRGNLAASLLLGGPVPTATSARLGFLAGLALVDAIEAVGLVPDHAGCEGSRQNPPPLRGRVRGPRIELKWPNDVLVDGAKLAGILLEAISSHDGGSRVVIGLGVNVADAPKGLSYPATALANNGARVTPERLFEALSDAWVDGEKLWDSGRGFPDIRHRWLERAAGLGAPIAVHTGAQMLRGLFETVDEEGRLVVRATDGSARTITAGEVHFGLAATAGN